MATESELNSLIQKAKNTYNRYKTTVGNCDAQIARLKPVYTKLGEIKNDFSSVRKDMTGIIDEKRFWCGEQYNTFCQRGDALDDACRRYYLLLDQAQDAVNTKIGELEAEKRRLVPLIGDLWGQMARWRTELQNLGN